MLGKIVRLLGVSMEDGFKVVEGVEFCKYGIADLRFATLRIYDNPLKNDYNVIYCRGFFIEKQHDGIKEFSVNNLALKDGMPEEKEVEEMLWVIIPYSSIIETTAIKIAGRYPGEGIFAMKEGDTIKVNKAGAVPEIYMAVQAGNEVFLVKKNR